MVLVLEAGAEMGVDLQGVVIGGKLERQGRVTLLLKAPVGIQHLEKKKYSHHECKKEINIFIIVRLSLH